MDEQRKRARMTTTVSDWRAAADPDDLREYDRFGPWIDQVTQPVDLPRRFRPWWPELSGARYVLKVPRPYDRAQVRPGMDLYESVIAVLPESLCVLQAGPTDIVRRDVAREDIVATIQFSDLLVGRWSLLLSDGSAVDIRYNTVSVPTITEVDRYLLSLPTPGEWSPGSTPPLRPRDLFFRSMTASLNPGNPSRIRPVHVEEPGQPCRTDRNRRRRSAGMMVLASPDDLVIFHRGMAAQPLFRRANYSSALVTIPFRLMTSFEVRRPAQTSPASFSQLVVACGQQVITQPCLARPQAVAALLVAHGVPVADRAEPAAQGA